MYIHTHLTPVQPMSAFHPLSLLGCVMVAHPLFCLVWGDVQDVTNQQKHSFNHHCVIVITRLPILQLCTHTRTHIQSTHTHSHTHSHTHTLTHTSIRKWQRTDSYLSTVGFTTVYAGWAAYIHTYIHTYRNAQSLHNTTVALPRIWYRLAYLHAAEEVVCKLVKHCWWLHTGGQLPDVLVELQASEAGNGEVASHLWDDSLGWERRAKENQGVIQCSPTSMPHMYKCTCDSVHR